MKTFRVTGANRETGAEEMRTVEAWSETDAVKLVGKEMLISAVEEVRAEPIPYASPVTAPAAKLPPSPEVVAVKRRKQRKAALICGSLIVAAVATWWVCRAAHESRLADQRKKAEVVLDAFAELQSSLDHGLPFGVYDSEVQAADLEVRKFRDRCPDADGAVIWMQSAISHYRTAGKIWATKYISTDAVQKKSADNAMQKEWGDAGTCLWMARSDLGIP